MFQVKHSKLRCILNIQAKNCVQEKEWVDTLSKLIEIEQNLSCPEKTSNGTVDDIYPIEQETDPELKIKLDPDRELERVHSLFVSNQVNMQTIMEACENGSSSVKIWKGYGKTHASQFMIEENFTLGKTLGKLRECVTQLEKNHQRYLERIHGSEISPIEVECGNANSIWSVLTLHFRGVDL